MNKSRIEAFSDGVLAIIITIMVLELKTPHGGEWSSLKPLLPEFGSYVLSFIYIGIYWGNHHHLVHTVRQINSGIIWTNLHLLFWLSLIPFSTAWMGDNAFAPNTVAVYAAILLMCGAAFTLLEYVIRRSNPATGQMATAFGKVERKGIISVVCYALSIPFAYVDGRISALLLIVVAIMWIVPDRNIEKAMKNL